MKALAAVATYTGLRLLLFLASCGLLYLAGLRRLLLVLVALVLTAVLSVLLLSRQRIAMGEAVGATVHRTRRRMAARTAAEDAAADRLHAQQSIPGTDEPGPGGPPLPEGENRR